ncbi:MAG: peptide chain release factor N(5)-glutamine methyltransferase [Gallionellaceae bacterium]|nr:MAG: peptide chain release factor N(5)-glutamine methyltransferase [Gallionellaceae bacterium]
MRSIHDVLRQDAGLLGNALALEANEARPEVQMLLQRVLGVGRAYLFAHSERVLGDAEETAYQALLQRRLAGEPIAYILGEREFFGLNLVVTPATLIPRPDTELLVELALERLPVASPPPFPLAGEGLGGEGIFRVLDMGTGSGAIALAIAQQHPDAEVWACDASAAALQVARGNAERHNISSVHFIESDWFSALDGRRFDIIVSNPPYIAAADHHLAQGDVRFEPLSALASGTDGLDDIRRIAAQARAHLEKNGWLLLEHGYDQAARVRELLQRNGFADVFSARDLSGIERCSGGRVADAGI